MVKTIKYPSIQIQIGPVPKTIECAILESFDVINTNCYPHSVIFMNFFQNEQTSTKRWGAQ